MISTNFTKICCNFHKSKAFKKSKTVAKMADCCLRTVSIAIVLKQNLIVIMEIIKKAKAACMPNGQLLSVTIWRSWGVG